MYFVVGIVDSVATLSNLKKSGYLYCETEFQCLIAPLLFPFLKAVVEEELNHHHFNHRLRPVVMHSCNVRSFISHFRFQTV
uniref:Uncharacterized protein n=1 Tax=Anguilla anguilla TaxID=7936 RepID=A0A0E9X0M5_ANGAN